MYKYIFIFLILNIYQSYSLLPNLINSVVPLEIYGTPNCTITYYLQVYYESPFAVYGVNYASHIGVYLQQSSPPGLMVVFRAQFTVPPGVTNDIKINVSNSVDQYYVFTLPQYYCEEFPVTNLNVNISYEPLLINTAFAGITTPPTSSKQISNNVNPLNYLTSDTGSYLISTSYSQPYSSLWSAYRNLTVGANYSKPLHFTFATSFNSKFYINITSSSQVLANQPTPTSFYDASSLFTYPPNNTMLYYTTLPKTEILFDVVNINTQYAFGSWQSAGEVVLGNHDRATIRIQPSGALTNILYEVSSTCSQLESINFLTQPNLSKIFNSISNSIVADNLLKIQLTVPDFEQITLRSNSTPDYIIPYPFGYSRINNSQIGYLVSIPTPNFCSTAFGFQVGYYSNFTIIPVPTQPCNPISPALTGLTYEVVGIESTLITANVTDPNVDGFYLMTVYGQNIAIGSLVQGNTSQPTLVFERPLNLQQVYQFSQSFQSVTFISRSRVSYVANYILDINLTQTPQFSPINNMFYAKDFNFTFAKFIPNQVDTSFGPVNVTFYFNITNADTNVHPMFNLYIRAHSYLALVTVLTAQADFDPIDQMYRVDFIVPQNMDNTTLYYQVLAFDKRFSLTKFGQDSTLTVYSNYTDKLAPLISYVKPYPNGGTVQIDQNQVNFTVGFEFQVQDRPNGLKQGWIEIISNIDGLPRRFDVVSSRVGGDRFSGTYRTLFQIQGNQCVNQTFTISKVYLQDNAGWISFYPEYQSTNIDQINPFVKIALSAPSNLSISFNINCQYDQNDIIGPEIKNFAISQQVVDVGSVDRQVQFQLTTSDSGSGLSIRHDPVVYLFSLNGDWLSIISSEKNYSLVTSSYKYTTVLPLGFGAYNKILVSVYGVVDNALNIAGFDCTTLESLSFPNRISTTYSTDKAVLVSSTTTYRNGGLITIRGRGFGYDGQGAIVQADFGQGYVNIPTVWVKQIILTANLPANITASSINVKVTSPAGYVSNVLTIIPKEYKVSVLNPPVVPISCPNSCSGHGTCTTSGCQCTSPWYGSDCSTQTIVVPKPPKNTTDPVIIIDDGGGGNNGTTGGNNNNSTNNLPPTKSVIAIYSLRELAPDSSLLNEYVFTSWTLTDLSVANQSTVYLYNTTLPGGTTLNVTIEWFEVATNRTFANELISLPPFSSKISMSLDRYPFASALNTIQLVLQVSIETTSGDQCSSQQYGLADNSINNVQWMRLAIQGKSLYGRFIRRAMVDGRPTTISNSIIEDQSSINPSSVLSTIGINIPNYQTSAMVDPDFAHIIDYDSSDSVCNEKKSNIPMIAGIVVGGSAAVALGAAGSIYFLKTKKWKTANKNLENRLSTISRD